MATNGTTVIAAYDRLAEAATAGLKVLLLDDSLTLDDSLEFVSEVASAEITGAAGYARKSMTGETYTAATGKLTGTCPVWASLGTAETVAYAVVFRDTGSDATSWVVSYFEADPAVTLNGGDFTFAPTDDLLASYGEASPDTVQAVQSVSGTAGYGALGYYKDRGRVWLSTSLSAGTSGSTGHTLPSGYRPAATVGPLPVPCNDGADAQALAWVTVTSAGVVTFTWPTGFDTLVVEGVSFRAA